MHASKEARGCGRPKSVVNSKALLFSAGGRYPYIVTTPGNCHRPPVLDKGAFCIYNEDLYPLQ